MMVTSSSSDDDFNNDNEDATTNNNIITKDKIVGSILGIFIGDALGVGVHWQYDLDKLKKHRGYVTEYLDPLPDTYHSGTPNSPGGLNSGKLHAGQLDLLGTIDKLLLESLVDNIQKKNHHGGEIL